LLKYLVVSYTHILNGKHTNLGGPAQHLAKYLGKKCYCIWQPIPVNKPTWVYALLKIRDIWLFLSQARPARVAVCVESLNALVGVFLRKLGLFKRVVYWNMDYSPTRGRIWLFLDRLAIHYADEVWVLKDRGLPKQKVVPIGCWYDEIDRIPAKEQLNAIVYIGLVEDMQGVGLMMEFAKVSQNLFYVIGTGKDIEKYKAMKLKNVVFYGILSDVEARKVLVNFKWGWDIYHPDNPTIKTTLPTKPMTYMSCGVIPISKDWSRSKCLAYARKHDWGKIFKEALR
jgi:hypothetical protein